MACTVLATTPRGKTLSDRIRPPYESRVPGGGLSSRNASYPRSCAHVTVHGDQPSTHTSSRLDATACGNINAWSEGTNKPMFPVWHRVLHSRCTQASRRFSRSLHRVIHRLVCDAPSASLAWGPAHRRTSPRRAFGSNVGGSCLSRQHGDDVRAFLRRAPALADSGVIVVPAEPRRRPRVDCRHLGGPPRWTPAA